MQGLETRMIKNYQAYKEWQWFITRKRTGMVQASCLVFCEKNEEMKLFSSATETSFLNEQEGEYEAK